MAQTIVVAWTTQEMVHDGRPVQVDLGQRPTFKKVNVPHACVWLNVGDESDVTKAQAHCDHENARLGDNETAKRVFLYDLKEKDPLGRAKKDVLAKS